MRARSDCGLRATDGGGLNYTAGFMYSCVHVRTRSDTFGHCLVRHVWSCLFVDCRFAEDCETEPLPLCVLSFRTIPLVVVSVDLIGLKLSDLDHISTSARMQVPHDLKPSTYSHIRTLSVTCTLT